MPETFRVTITSKALARVLPAASVAVQVTVVVPIAKPT